MVWHLASFGIGIALAVVCVGIGLWFFFQMLADALHDFLRELKEFRGEKLKRQSINVGGKARVTVETVNEDEA